MYFGFSEVKTNSMTSFSHPLGVLFTIYLFAAVAQAAKKDSGSGVLTIVVLSIVTGILVILMEVRMRIALQSQEDMVEPGTMVEHQENGGASIATKTQAPGPEA